VNHRQEITFLRASEVPPKAKGDEDTPEESRVKSRTIEQRGDERQNSSRCSCGEAAFWGMNRGKGGTLGRYGEV